MFQSSTGLGSRRQAAVRVIEVAQELLVGVDRFPLLAGVLKNCLLAPPLAPAVPLVGEKLAVYGMTLNFPLLFSVPPEVVTVTKPVVAPLGTIAVR